MTTTPSRKHGWPFWFAFALIAIPILYVVSIGPAVWLFRNGHLSYALTSSIFRPLIVTATRGPEWLQMPLRKYAAIFADPVPKIRPFLHLPQDDEIPRNDNIVDTLSN